MTRLFNRGYLPAVRQLLHRAVNECKRLVTSNNDPRLTIEAELATADGSFKLFEELKKIELAEDLFGTDLPVDLTIDNPREIVDYLALQLRGWGPSPVAADFLKQLATKRNSPALAQGVHGSWRREQISAIIEEIFNIGDLSGGGDDHSVIPVRKPHGPKSGGRAAAQSLDDDNP